MASTTSGILTRRPLIEGELARRIGLKFFVTILGIHLLEHVVQIFQLYVLRWEPTRAVGLLGMRMPGLVQSEALHFGFNLIVLLGLALLLPAVQGIARRWWMAALCLQLWHYVEHGLLLAQRSLGANLWNKDVPTSVLQLVFPRAELHFFYNAVISVPVLIAFYYANRRNGRSSREGGLPENLGMT